MDNLPLKAYEKLKYIISMCEELNIPSNCVIIGLAIPKHQVRDGKKVNEFMNKCESFLLNRNHQTT